MSFLNSVKQLFSSSNSRAISSPEDAVILYLFSLIPNSEEVQAQKIVYEHIRTLKDKTERDISYITLYSALEKYIINHKPPEVTQLFTKASLREVIRSNIHIDSLPSGFKLLFLPEAEQALVLFEGGLQYVIRYIVHNLGITSLHRWIADLADKKPLDKIIITETGIDLSKIHEGTAPISLEEIVNSYQTIYGALYAEVRNTLGEKNAHALFSSSLKSVQEKYDDELLAQFLNILPHEVAEEDRLALLSKQELEKRVKEAVSLEKQKEDELEREKLSIEQKVMERTRDLTRLEAQLESSIDSLRVGFIMLDKDRKIIRMNGSAQLLLLRKTLGGKQDVPIAEKAKMLKEWTVERLSEDFKESFDLLQTLDMCINQRKPLDVRGVSFADRFLHVFLSPIVEFSEVEVIGAVILLEDVTETKLLERSKDEFFSIASHELRTPLTAIRGNAAMMQDYFAPILKQDPKLEKMVDDIYKSSLRLIEIVSDFLDMSRIEQGKALFKKEEIDLITLAEDVKKELSAVLSQKNLTCTIEKPESDLKHIVGDSDRVRQVFLNLVMNAIRYTEVGGITVRFEQRDPFVKVYIIDTGRGIPPMNQNLLFRKFQQAGSNILTRDTTRGTGLGLYITKLMVEGMNGEVALEHSEEHKGSTFSFMLPTFNSSALPVVTKEQSLAVVAN